MSDRPANRAYLSLGSNIEPEQNLPAAVRALAAFGRVVAVSSVWESAPFGVKRQQLPERRGSAGDGTIRGEDLSTKPSRRSSNSSAEFGDPHDKNAPRTIDVDLSLFNRDVFELAGHRIPDPDIVKRPFVAVPLAELDPDYVHPTVGRTLADIAASWTTNSGLRPRPDVRLC